jgi:hypothetical protein
MRHMVVMVPELTGYASIRHIAVSLPYASQLIDHVKYMEPQDVKQPEGDTERRRQRAPRGPSYRSLVKLALACNSAEELGQRIRQRYQRQRPPGRREQRETEAALDRLLADPAASRGGAYHNHPGSDPDHESCWKSRPG